MPRTMAMCHFLLDNNYIAMIRYFLMEIIVTHPYNKYINNNDKWVRTPIPYDKEKGKLKDPKKGMITQSD